MTDWSSWFRAAAGVRAPVARGEELAFVCVLTASTAALESLAMTCRRTIQLSLVHRRRASPRHRKLFINSLIGRRNPTSTMLSSGWLVDLSLRAFFSMAAQGSNDWENRGQKITGAKQVLALLACP